jgi:hypothetical protein
LRSTAAELCSLINLRLLGGELQHSTVGVPTAKSSHRELEHHGRRGSRHMSLGMATLCIDGTHRKKSKIDFGGYGSVEVCSPVNCILVVAR